MSEFVNNMCRSVNKILGIFIVISCRFFYKNFDMLEVNRCD
jgi:hypothetical protein